MLVPSIEGDANPSHGNAHINLTRAYVEERRFSELFKMHADDADALRRIGVTLNRGNEHEIAIRFFQRSLAVEHDVETYVQLGIAYGNMGRMVEARNAARRALLMEPGHEGALVVLRLTNK